MNHKILDVQNLDISIPVDGGILHAVRGISFSVNKGETLCLVGESGCGKSLTALAIMGLLTPRAKRTSDILRYLDHDLNTLRNRALRDLRGQEFAMIFQDPMSSLNPTMTIGRQMTEGIVRYENISRNEAERQAVSLLERVGIAQADARMSQFPHQFSGGQRQRIMIAMALMGKPKLLIADEPTTALDVTIQAQILTLLHDIKEEFGLSLLLITHDFGVVASVADRVAVMYAGRIVESGESQDIFNVPSHPYTQGLMAAIPVPGITEPGTQLQAIKGKVPELIGHIEGCAFKPRCVVSTDRCSLGKIPVQSRSPHHEYECVLSPQEWLSR